MRALAALAFLAATAQAQVAPSVIGVHLVSVHAGHTGSTTEDGRNNANVGLYLRWDSGLTVGAFRNSLYRTSYYAGWTFTDRADRFSLGLGVVTGYDRVAAADGADHRDMRCAEGICRMENLRSVLLPMVVPSLRLPITKQTSARVWLIVAPRQPAVAHLSLERRF